MTALLSSNASWKAPVVVLLGVATFTIGTGRAALSQAPVSPEAAACPSVARLPLVPMQPPRPSEGKTADQKWEVPKQGRDAAPTASFIDSLRGNDAAIEVVLGQGRLLTLKGDIGGPRGSGVVAVGDPTILEFDVLPNPRMLRLVGRRVGVTDISITTAQGDSYSFEVKVSYDLPVLRAQLREAFPDAEVRLAQLREHLIVEGQAHSPAQVKQIVTTLEAYLQSVQVPQEIRGREEAGRGMAPSGGELPTPAPAPMPPAARPPKVNPTSYAPAYGAPDEQPPMPGEAVPGAGGRVSSKATFAKPQIINLMRVVGLHQVLLQVRVAELNRTATRRIGADILGIDPASGTILGTNINATVNPNVSGATAAGAGLTGAVSQVISPINPAVTAFGIFQSANFDIMLQALRRNSLINILAEPNLVAMDGHQASFLAGGQFPVPVAQTGGGIGGTAPITIEWKDFGVQLNFVPTVMDDQTIRLHVAPEVSEVNFALGTTIAGTTVPAITTRKSETTVELHRGQTLAIAGLLQVTMDGTTSRIPLLGDLPYIGPFFSNTTHARIEKELLVLVTPHLVKGMDPDQVGPEPGAEVKDPTDWEFYLMNRIEGRNGREFRSTIHRDEPSSQVQLERKYISGPVGHSNQPEPKPSR